MSSHCASTTRKPCTPGLRTWRAPGTKLLPSLENLEHEFGASTWAGRLTASTTAELRCTRSSGPSPLKAVPAGCHGPGLGGAEKWKTTREAARCFKRLLPRSESDEPDRIVAKAGTG